MRVEIKSKLKFQKMLQELFSDKSIPLIGGCSINSKNINKGDLFLPIKGQKFDGHDFIEEAIRNGASLILNEKNITNDTKVPFLNVENIIDCIKKIAYKWRLYTNCEIIGITGSNGKTSTKEMLNQVISSSKKVMFSKDNYNSTLGLPISMFSISEEDDLCILEMGANKCGEIAELCRIARPNHGLITNISNAHNEYFGSISNIAKNKLQLFDSLPSNGYAFINMDDDYLKKSLVNSNVITYGFDGNYDFIGKYTNDYIYINNHKIKLPYPNRAIAQNYLATYSVSTVFGLEPFEIIESLENMPIYSGRGEIIKKNNLTYINDTYNANLSSCSNGINALLNIDASKRILVLGDMHELGGKTKSEHIKLGNIINKSNIDAVFGIGEYIQYTLDAIKMKKIFKKHFKSKQELIVELENYSASNDIIYVKGSRSMKMEEIIYNEEK